MDDVLIEAYKAIFGTCLMIFSARSKVEKISTQRVDGIAILNQVLEKAKEVTK